MKVKWIVKKWEVSLVYENLLFSKILIGFWLGEEERVKSREKVGWFRVEVIKSIKSCVILWQQTHSSNLHTVPILSTRTHPETSSSDPFLVLRRWLAVTGNWLECAGPSNSAPAIDAERFSRSRRCDDESESIAEPELLSRRKRPITEFFCLWRLVMPPFFDRRTGNDKFDVHRCQKVK